MLVHGDAAFAGQGVVAETLNLSEVPGLRGRRHRARRRQQPARLHHRARARPFDRLRHRRRQDGAGADLPRERRRPRGRGARDPPRVRVPAGVPEGRRRRHGLLPPVRPQRGRRARVHAAAHVRADRRGTARSASSTPSSSCSAATSRSRSEQRARDDFKARLDAGVRGDARRPRRRRRRRRRRRLSSATTSVAASTTPVATGVPRDDARRGRRRARDVCPTASPCNPKLERSSSRRRARRSTNDEIDWALAEALAFGSLVLEGTPVRLAGQDTRRGTFSQRHGVLVDQETEREYVPLAHLAADQAPFMLYDSVLSEYAALGFEYGYSVSIATRSCAGKRSSATSPTARRSSSTSSSSPPRTSGASAAASRCCSPTASRARAPSTRARASSGSSRCAPRTTCASSTRRPRRSTSTCCAARCHGADASRWCASRRSATCACPRPARRVERSPTARFAARARRPRSAVTRTDVGPRVVLCTGKIAHELMDERDARRRAGRGRPRRAAVPVAGARARCGARRATPTPREVWWVQEEPANMGAWNFVRGRLAPALGDRALHHVARASSASPATGSVKIHDDEQRAADHERPRRRVRTTGSPRRDPRRPRGGRRPPRCRSYPVHPARPGTRVLHRGLGVPRRAGRVRGRRGRAAQPHGTGAAVPEPPRFVRGRRHHGASRRARHGRRGPATRTPRTGTHLAAPLAPPRAAAPWSALAARVARASRILGGRRARRRAGRARLGRRPPRRGCRRRAPRRRRSPSRRARRFAAGAGAVGSACCSTTWCSGARRIASRAVAHPHVLVTGTPYVDVWQAVRPAGARYRRVARGPEGHRLEGRCVLGAGRRRPWTLWRRILRVRSRMARPRATARARGRGADRLRDGPTTPEVQGPNARRTLSTCAAANASSSGACVTRKR